ncbi:MAG TPA: diaminopimelate epimerase [Desulfotomaculum sp.]|nr:diaminopimelate epimerase [Desulfotomaculum sp.]
MQFIKMHGLGNDFVITVGESIGPDPGELARRICDRHFGVGADGLVFILPAESADLQMRIFNPDGSEAEMCGNAIRCVAKYAFESGMVERTEFRMETGAGVLSPRLFVEAGLVKEVEVDMGRPVLERERIPMQGPPGRVINEPLDVAGEAYRITAVSFGNPHCVVFVTDVSAINLPVVGPVIENHPAFPRRTNVEFVQVLSPDSTQVRVWERGAGETLACGTGACAAAVAGFLNGLTGRRVLVRLPGGDLSIFWAEDDHVYMTGPAVAVFEGRWISEVRGRKSEAKN